MAFTRSSSSGRRVPATGVGTRQWQEDTLNSTSETPQDEHALSAAYSSVPGPLRCVLLQGKAEGGNEVHNERSGSSTESSSLDGVGDGRILSSDSIGEMQSVLKGHKARRMSALQHVIVSEDHEVCLHMIWKASHQG